MSELKTNVLYYGDNLDVLRQHIPDESIDLIYLDPPFNSKRSYNVLFRESSGAASDAQIEAFEDTWRWGPSARQAYEEVITGPNQKVARTLKALVDGLEHNEVTAYLCMMSVRLVELHRVLKGTGSIYLHCDPSAGPYLRIIMDALFYPKNFIREIVWAYGTPSGGRVSGAKPVKGHDTILAYAKSYGSHKYKMIHLAYSQKYIEERFVYVDENGRRYRTRKRKGVLTRQYLDESKGIPLSDTWSDIKQLYAYHWKKRKEEELGFETQKPLALLERIIKISSDQNDLVLDPFCGCGTTVYAANKLVRRWIGIDITYLAINLIERRMRDAFKEIEIDVIGEPKDLASAKDLARRDKWQFQWWALTKINAQPVASKKKGADRGIDGVIPFFAGPTEDYKRAIVSVKGGEHVGVSVIRDLVGVIERENEPIGIVLTLEPPTQPMITEAASAGFYASEFWGRKFPRIQILTIEEMFKGVRPELPWGKSPYAKAPKEHNPSKQLPLV